MSEQNTPSEPNLEDWPSNYFNYFTEIEEHFQRARGTSLFLLSPLDWALVENWKAAGVPLEAVLQGIDDAFEKWRSRKRKTRAVNSLAYCTQAVMEAAERMPSRSLSGDGKHEGLFAASEISAHLGKAIDALRKKSDPAFLEIADSLQALVAQGESHARNIQALEQHLTALEDKMVAVARAVHSSEGLLAIRQSLDAELTPYRGKMTAEQIFMLERRYVDSALLERAELPRLSLFYLY